MTVTRAEFREKVYVLLWGQYERFHNKSGVDFEAKEQAGKDADEIVQMACGIDDWDHPILPDKPGIFEGIAKKVDEVQDGQDQGD